MENLEQKHIIFFDGDCGVCNFWVQFILERDKKNEFLFASLQSEFGQTFLKERNLNLKEFNTLYLWKQNSYYFVKSKAVLKILSILGGFYSTVAFIGNLIPKYITDKIYDAISRNRMKISNQKCFLPTPNERQKFIEI